MSSHAFRFLTVFGVAVAVLPLQAQAPAAPADPRLAEAHDALTRCIAFAERQANADAATLGRRAESLFQSRVARQPRDVDAIVGLARAQSQCILPSMGFMEQGEMSAHAMELLESALQIDSTHWTARFVLASINLRSPSFLGRASRAARELDVLLRQQGDRTDNPRFARVFEYRGALWSRSGNTDSARAVWQRGARLFPADSVLRALVERAGPGAGSASGGAPATPARLVAVAVVASSSAAPPSASSQSVGRSQVLLTAGGAADVLQAVQLLPGATRVAEGSDVYTRGGDARETALLVNGGRLTTLSRFEGLSGGMFGAIEPFVVKAVRYSSGAFSARHGNALSGVLEIETDGRPRERQLRAGASLVQASGTARVPFSPTTGGWVSARVSNTGALLATHGRTEEFVGAPHSEEMIASLVSNPSPGTELRATGIVERDDARRITDAAGWVGPFHAAGATRSVVLSSRWMAPTTPVTVRTTLVGGSHRTDWSFGVLSRLREERNELARVDVEVAPREAVMVRAGLEQGAATRREHGTVPTTGSVAQDAPSRALPDIPESANQIGAYAEAQLGGDATSLLVGLRADRLPGEAEVTVDPRVTLGMRRGEWTARVGAGVFHQGRWRTAPVIPDAGTPSGVARAARHLVVGVERDAGTSILRAEAFAKTYGEYAALGDGPRIESGRARGVDLLAQRKSGRVTGWLGYSLLDATVRLSDGRSARSPFDVTHSATLALSSEVTERWSVGSTLRYGTGAPHTPILGGQARSDGRIAPLYGAVMADRLPGYARLDARVMRFFRTPTALVTSFVEMLNVTNRPNASGVTYDASYSTQRPVRSFFATRTVVAGVELQFR